MEQTNEKLWTKEFITLSVINFLATIVYFLLIVTIAKFAVSEFNVSTSTAGLASSIFIIGSLIGRLGAGQFIGKLGSKRTLLLGLICFFITTILYFASFTITLLLVYRLLQGIAVGLVGTATGTIIAQILPINRRGEGIGYFSLSAILATAVGPYIGLFLMEHFEGFQSIFIFNTILAIIVVVIFFFIKFPPALAKPVQSGKVKTTENTGVLSKFIEVRALPISIVSLFVGLAYSGVLSFMSFYTAEINLVEIGSYFFLIYAAVIILTRPLTGKLLDARGANVIIYPCLIIFAIGMYVFSSATTSMIFILAAICIGIGYGNFTSVAQAVAVKVTPRERVGLATSTFFILYDIGLGFGPYVLGKLVPSLGYRSIFASMVGVIIVSIILYYFLHGKKESASRLVATSESNSVQ